MWWIARGVGPLTGDYSHSLQMWLMSITHECCAKKSMGYIQCNANLGISWVWGSLLVGFSSFRLFMFALDIRGVWEVLTAKCLKNMEGHKNEYS